MTVIRLLTDGQKAKKQVKKVVRFAEKQYLCGRKAVIAFTYGPQRRQFY